MNQHFAHRTMSGRAIGDQPGVDNSNDPLIAAIEAFRASNATYNAAVRGLAAPSGEEEEEAIAATCAPPLEALSRWEAPAITREGALAALRLALEELDDDRDTPIVRNMAASALAYFDSADEAIADGHWKAIADDPCPDEVDSRDHYDVLSNLEGMLAIASGLTEAINQLSSMTRDPAIRLSAICAIEGPLRDNIESAKRAVRDLYDMYFADKKSRG